MSRENPEEKATATPRAAGIEDEQAGFGSPEQIAANEAESFETRDPISLSMFAAVSCTDGPFCIGADHTTGTVFVDHGRGFEARSGVPPLLDIAPEACGSAHFCLVMPVSSYRYARFDGQRVEPIAQPPGNPELENLSCTEEEVCMASVAETDEALVYSP